MSIYSHTCSKCKLTKDVSNFSKNKSKKSGLNTYCKECMVAYRKDNANKLKKYFKEYGEANREKISARSLRRYQNNIQANLATTLRNRFNRAVKKEWKKGSAVRDLGCTITEFKIYLESKFQDGMSWENKGRGGWHIDHMIPLSAFDLTDREQVKEACHYTNLQPLWEVDNLIKGNNI
jgi:hypothetical protein